MRLVDCVVFGGALNPLAEGLVPNRTLERLFLVNCESNRAIRGEFSWFQVGLQYDLEGVTPK